MGIVFDQSLNTTDSPSFVDGNFSGDITVDGRIGTTSGSNIDGMGTSAGYLRFFNNLTAYWNNDSLLIGVNKTFRPQIDGNSSVGLEAARFGDVYSVNGSFTGNLNTEVGGSLRMFSLGTDGDTDTETLDIEFDSLNSKWEISTNQTGSGLLRQLWFDASQFRMYESGNLLWIGESNEMRMYGSLVPSSDGLRSVGIASKRFGDAFFTRGNFSGDVTVGGDIYAPSGDTQLVLGVNAVEPILVVRNNGTYTNGDLYGGANATYDCGTSTFRWANVFSVSGNFSGTVTANTITSTGGNLTLQRNSADAIIVGGTFIQCYHEIRPATNNLYSSGTSALRWVNTYSVDGSFSGNLITEVGGSPRIYNLGASGDVDTEYLDISWQGGNCKFKSQTTGAGVERRLDFEGSGIRYIAAGITVADISAGDIRLYSNRTIRPLLDNDASVGKTAQRFTNVYSYAGDFAGTITNSATTSWSATFSRAIRVGADSGVSWYYSDGNMTKFNTPVTFESSFQFARPADGLTSRLYRMSKAASSFTCVPVDGGVSGNIIFQVEDATDTFQPLRTGGYVNHYPSNAGEQAYRMYNLGEAGDTATEYGGFDFTSNVFRVGTQTTGVGVARDVGIIRNGSFKMYFGSSLATIYQTLVPNIPDAINVGSITNYFARTFSNAVFTNVQTITAATDSLVTTDTTNLCDCTLNQIDIDIPTSSSDYVGNEYVIKKIDASANTVVITPTGRTIEGAASLTLTTQYESVSIISDGTNWFIKHQT